MAVHNRVYIMHTSRVRVIRASLMPVRKYDWALLEILLPKVIYPHFCARRLNTQIPVSL